MRRQNLEAEGPAEVTHFTQGETEARGGGVALDVLNPRARGAGADPDPDPQAPLRLYFSTRERLQPHLDIFA